MAGLQPWRGNLRVAQRSYSGLIIWLLPVGLALGLCACSRTPDPEVAVPPAVETLAPADAAAEPVAEDVAPVVAETSEPLADRVPETAETASDEASDALESAMLPAQKPADPDAEPFPAPESSEAIAQPQAEEPGVVETAEEAAAEMDEKSDEMAEAPVTLRAEEWADAADPTVLEPLETVAENLAEPETDAVVSAEPSAEIVSSEPVPPQTNAAALVNPEVVVPAGQTVFVAMEAIFRQISLKLNYLELLDAETIEKIKQTPATFGTDKPTKWDDALREILKPQNLDFIEEGEIVRVGPKAAIDQRHSVYAQEQLAANHAAIDVNFSEGIPLYAALRHIQSEAKLNVNFDWMAPEDRGIFKPTTELKADEVAAAPPPAKITTYATPPGNLVKWRTVLTEVLSPFGYAFVEVDGVVRILMQAQADQWKKDQLNARPLATKLIRVRHNDPQKIVDRVKETGVLSGHANAQITVAQGWDNNSLRYTGPAAGDAEGGGEGQSYGGTVEGITSFGSLRRPTIPPAVLVRDLEENIPLIEEKIRLLDRREKQVLIEAKIFDLGKDASRNLGTMVEQFGGRVGIGTSYASGLNRNRTNTSAYAKESGYRRDRQRGIDYVDRSADSATNVDTFVQAITDTDLYAAVRESTWGLAQSVVLNPFEMQASWEAIQSAGDAKVVSQPVIVLGDHNEATIRVTTLDPFVQKRVKYIGPADSRVPEVVYEWLTVELGLSLWVTPEISEDNTHVRLSIHPSLTEKTGEKTNPEGSTRPIVAVREVDTRVTVPDRHTLLLGGLIKSYDSVAVTKVPLLGDLPLIGFLFRHKSTSKEQMNLVIMITPTILNDEYPNSGYENPALAHVQPMLKDLGKNLPPPAKIEKEAKKAKAKKPRAKARPVLIEPSSPDSSTWPVPDGGDSPLPPGPGVPPTPVQPDPPGAVPEADGRDAVPPAAVSKTGLASDRPTVEKPASDAKRSARGTRGGAKKPISKPNPSGPLARPPAEATEGEYQVMTRMPTMYGF